MSRETLRGSMSGDRACALARRGLVRDAGANAVQELAFTLAAGHCYVTEAVKRGLAQLHKAQRSPLGANVVRFQRRAVVW